MAVTRHYLRNAQTVSGTGGTIYDLSTTQGTPATLASAAISATTFTKVFEWRFQIGATTPAASIPLSISISAVSASTLAVRWRVSRINSGGTVVASSGYSAEYNTVGTKTDTVSLTTAWATGDFFAVEMELRRAGGGGSRTVTININNTASYADPDLLLPRITGTLGYTEVGQDTTFIEGLVKVSGALGYQETTQDAPQFEGAPRVTGALAVTETGEDTILFESAALERITGFMVYVEPAPDTIQIDGLVLNRGSMAVPETTTDTQAFVLHPRVTGALAWQNVGQDGISFVNGNAPPPAWAEENQPNHPFYQRRYHVKLARMHESPTKFLNNPPFKPDMPGGFS